MDLRQGPDGDLVIGTDGDLEIVEDAAYVGQRVRMRLQAWLGESPYDTSAGFPWVDGVFGKQPIAGIRFLLERYIRETEGVQDVEGIDFALDATARELTITGKLLVDEVWQPLSLEISTT